MRTLVEEQANRIVEQTTLIEAQTTLIEKMRAEMTVLLARLSSNSRTSSKPPSSDGYSKPDPKSRRVRSGLKPGKQPGDPGHHLAQRLDPDVTVIHAPTSCRHCGDDLTDAEVTETITRQVFELPSMALRCTEHQAQRKRCSCGTLTTGEFPSDATAPACYGPALLLRLLPRHPPAPAHSARGRAAPRHLRHVGLDRGHRRHGARRSRDALWVPR